MLLVVLILIGLIASAYHLFQPTTRNWAFNTALKAVLHQPADYPVALKNLESIVPQDCRVNWQIGLLALRMENPPDIETNLHNMLDCSPKAVDWLFLMAPQRRDLAYRASQLYPQEARIWLWLGDLARTDEDLALADKNYTESARLDSNYGLAWCRLGAIKEKQELLEDAVDAFWQCCQNGDPGSHGCYGAGRIAEKLGDIPNAIRYYHRSHFLKALERAEELEQSR